MLVSLNYLQINMGKKQGTSGGFLQIDTLLTNAWEQPGDGHRDGDILQVLWI